MNIFKRIANKFIYGKGVFIFIRSSLSSQVASWIDMGSSTLLVAMGVSQWFATPIGAVIGGIVNCCINYKFTFRATGCSVKAVAVKYVLIWLGSVLFNTVGTSLLASVFDSWHILDMLGFTTVGSYFAARLIVSLVVSILWNFLMQKHFVYRPRERFDPYAIRAVDGLLWVFNRKPKTEQK